MVLPQVYTSLARAYRTYAAALPLPPDGSPLEVIVHNELNTPGECGWAAVGDLVSGGGQPYET